MPAPELIAVQAGSITLADRRSQTSWTVAVAAFELGRTPAVDADGMPLVEVSWFDAVAHCNELSRAAGLTPAYAIDGEAVEWDRTSPGFRLPTEAEWEYACRAGTTTARYGELDEIAWHRGTSGERLHEAAQLAPNPWGFHDMLGNVWEWCWDVYDAEVYGEYRVMRGGGWMDERWSCRASVRRRSHPTFHIDDVGFRVARGRIVAEPDDTVVRGG